ncbi:hypothetical protein QCA50_015524 [Cerrena zonata]|uniref:Uncharacterized protein n=1 Tax=Cerrena zonata TaxID=2478898 RepID=A0AAW0FVW7_9APHY
MSEAGDSIRSDTRVEDYTTEAHLSWKLFYQLWRIDEAARAFHGALSQAGDFGKALVYRRWEIGLISEVYEQESLEKALAHMCLLGLMTTRLSKAIHRRFHWLNIDEYPPDIYWDRLPDANTPSAPDLTTLFDGVVPQMLEGNLDWWTYVEGTSPKEEEPYWWENPTKEVELFLYLIKSLH